MDDKTLQMAMLLDFFGELLTDKQREYFELYYNENLSLAEIAAQYGITRQGVYEVVSRAERTLLEFEEKTGVVARFNMLQGGINEALEQARRLAAIIPGGESNNMALELCDTLNSLKGKV